MRSLLIGQQRAGQCDLLKWKVSFSGKPHLRCQTTQTQCWKMKILEGGRCIFRNKWIISSCLVTCYILYNSWDLRLLSHVLYLSSTHWRRAKWGSPSQCWLTCQPSSVALSVQPLTESKGACRNQSVEHAAPWLAALSWQPSLIFPSLKDKHVFLKTCTCVSVYTRPVVLQDI